MGKINGLKCVLCGNSIISFRYKAMRQWNVSGELCGKCYQKKLTEYYISNESGIIKNS